MKNGIICMFKGRKKLMSLLMTVSVMVGLLAVPVTSSASSCVQSSVSRTEVSSSLSSCTFPGDISTLTSGSTYYFNLAGDSACRFESAKLYVRQANERSYKCVYNCDSKKSFSYTSKSLQIKGSGTLQYYWKVKYADVHRTETLKTVRRTVCAESSRTGYSVSWRDASMEETWDVIRTRW